MMNRSVETAQCGGRRKSIISKREDKLQQYAVKTNDERELKASQDAVLNKKHSFYKIRHK